MRLSLSAFRLYAETELPELVVSGFNFSFVRKLSWANKSLSYLWRSRNGIQPRSPEAVCPMQIDKALCKTESCRYLPVEKLWGYQNWMTRFFEMVNLINQKFVLLKTLSNSLRLRISRSEAMLFIGVIPFLTLINVQRKSTQMSLQFSS